MCNAEHWINDICSRGTYPQVFLFNDSWVCRPCEGEASCTRLARVRVLIAYPFKGNARCKRILSTRRSFGAWSICSLTCKEQFLKRAITTGYAVYTPSRWDLLFYKFKIQTLNRWVFPVHACRETYQNIAYLPPAVSERTTRTFCWGCDGELAN